MGEFTSNNVNHFKDKRIKILTMGITIFLLSAAAALAVLVFIFPTGNLRTVLLVFLMFFLISLSMLTLILRRFFSSLALINEKAENLSRGDLNISDILLEKTRGLESLTIAFNDLKYNFLSFIELTKGNIITLSDAIDQVSGSIDMSYAGNEQIASNMSLISAKAQEQLELVKDTIQGVESSSMRIEEITFRIENIEKHIEQTVKTANEGTLNLNSFYAQLNNISNNLDGTNRFINQLNKEISKITDISEFIIQVSEQLKLLGLNAAIEAARAGEAGKGFTVVAHQIRALSSKTQESIKEINNIVLEVIKSSENVNHSISSFIDNFNESKAEFNTVQESFNIINKQSQELNTDIKEIYREINNIDAFTKGIKAKGIELHDASDDISSKTQNVAAVTEEASAELEEIAGHTTNLKDMLMGIQNLVRKFNTSVLPVEQKSSKRLKLAFLSLLDHEFWNTIRQGVIYAQKELNEKNASVEFFGFEIYGEIPLQDRVVSRMKECIDKGYDGIVLPAFFPLTVPLVEEASMRGIPVMVFNCDFEIATSRLAYFGPNTYEAGRLAGKLMVKALGESGNVIMARGDLDGRVHASRREAILEVLGGHKKIKLLRELNTGDDINIIYKEIKTYLASNRDVQGVFVTGGGVEGAAKAIEELGLTGKVKVVGFDHNKEIFEYVKKGIIYAAIGQDPFGQGHDPLVWLYNYIVTGKQLPGENMWSRLDIVDSSNVNDLLAK